MQPLIDWLLAGDVSLQYLTRKYLLAESEETLLPLRKRIAVEGWGKAFLDARNPSGHWGKRFYQPKWTSTHYTLLDLRCLEVEPVEPIQETLQLILEERMGEEGSIRESAQMREPGDICVNGMFLNYASFFGVPETQLAPIVDYLLDNVLPDGGFNCSWKYTDTNHSSMHSTISVLEGLWEFQKAGHSHRQEDIEMTRKGAEEFLFQHRLYKSDKTGRVIDPSWTRLAYPPRWHYDILRALVYFADAGTPYDARMEDALQVLLSKRRPDGTWPLQAPHPGHVHFELEPVGSPSRLNTLRALRVLKYFEKM